MIVYSLFKKGKEKKKKTWNLKKSLPFARHYNSIVTLILLFLRKLKTIHAYGFNLQSVVDDKP